MEQSSSGGYIVSSMKEKFVDYGETTKRNLRIIMQNSEHSVFTFSGSSLKKIRISEGIVSIPQNAFKGCTNITSIGPVGSGADVEIPNSVTSIENGAFQGCTGLTSVSLPNNIINIGNGAFQGCTSLEELNILGNPQISSEAFNGSVDNLPSEGNIVYVGNIAYCLKDNESTQSAYTIKNGTKVLNKNLFNANGNITTISLPSSLEKISESCFAGCSSLNSIKIPNGVTEIGSYALESTSFATIGKTNSGSDVELPDTLTYIGQSCFRNCSNLTDVIIPDSVSTIESDTFSNCPNLNSFNTGHGVKTISGAFREGTTLNTLILGKNVSTLDSLFGYNGNEKEIQNLTLNSAIPYDWYSRTYIKATNLTIGKYFPRLSEITDSFSNSIVKTNQPNIYCNFYVDSENPYYYAGDNHAYLVSADEHKLLLAKSQYHHNIKDNTILEVGDGKGNCYVYGSGLQSIRYNFILPKSVTKINRQAFYEALLYELVIPENVTYIDYRALYDCAYDSGTLYFKSLVPPTINDLTQLYGKYTIKVPAASYNEYKSAWADYATRIIPDDYSQVQQQWNDMYECCVDGELHMLQKRQLSSDGQTWYDSYVNGKLDTRYNETVRGTCESSLDIDLNNQFTTSTSYGNLNSEDYDFFESTIAKNVTGQNSMILTLYGYQRFTFKISASVYSNYYQHIVVNNINDMTTKTTGGSRIGEGKASDGYTFKYVTSSSWNDVTFTNLTGNEVKIKITYVQASTYNSDSYKHKGYVAIPKVQP